jgi:hypothetical protein
VVPAQTSGDVSENNVAVVEFDGERRAREHLFDAAEYLERGFFVILGNLRFGRARIRVALASCDN